MPYTATLHLHTLTFWIILLSGLWAVVRAWRGRLTGATWAKGDRMAGLVFSSALATQFLFGLLLYCLSPAVRPLFDHAALAPPAGGVHFFGLLHPPLMLLAATAGQIGFSVSKRVPGDVKKFHWAALCYTAALVVVLLVTPWPGLPYGRSLVP